MGYTYYLHIKNENEKIENEYAKLVYNIYKGEIFPAIDSFDYEELKSAYEDSYYNSNFVYEAMGLSFVSSFSSRFYELCDKATWNYDLRWKIENSLSLISRLFETEGDVDSTKYKEDNREKIFNNLKIFHRELITAIDKELLEGKTYDESLSLACIYIDKEGFYKGSFYYGWGR